jgi:hypothetical protein
MKLLRTVVVDKPLGAVFGYPSDFTTSTEWDPGTVRTVRQKGDGGVGTVYLNTSTFLKRRRVHVQGGSAVRGAAAEAGAGAAGERGAGRDTGGAGATVTGVPQLSKRKDGQSWPQERTGPVHR